MPTTDHPLVAAMKSRKMGPTDLARLAGLPQPTISNFLHGRRAFTGASALKIQKVLPLVPLECLLVLPKKPVEDLRLRRHRTKPHPSGPGPSRRARA